jgi:S1-C subfamily serine protease
VSTSLDSLSRELVAAVAAAAPSLVRVEGRRRGASSGVVWSAEGVIVASHHAIDADEGVPVGLEDGRTLEARVVGRDPGTDLALLRVEAGDLRPPRWAEADAPATGALVLGLSRPGRAVRARLGIVSAVAPEWRTPAGSRLEGYLESDLPLHPGFSGGLLLSAGGAALGVNTAGLLRGTSLAVPARGVRRVVETLLAHGRVRRGYLGIGTQAVALPPGAGQASGLIVLSVAAGSPAARAGLLLGDVLLRAGDEPLAHPGALQPALDADRVGQELRLRVLRAGEARDVAVVVGEREAA